MFEDRNITKEKVKDILYAVRNEFENEVSDIDDTFEDEITDREIDLMFKFLDMFIDKTNMVIDDEVRDTTRDLELLNGLVNYVGELWNINETEEEVIEHYKRLGFTDDDLIRLGIKEWEVNI